MANFVSHNQISPTPNYIPRSNFPLHALGALSRQYEPCIICHEKFFEHFVHRLEFKRNFYFQAVAVKIKKEEEAVRSSEPMRLRLVDGKSYIYVKRRLLPANDVTSPQKTKVLTRDPAVQHAYPFGYCHYIV